MVGDHQPRLTLPSSLLRIVGRVRRQSIQHHPRRGWTYQESQRSWRCIVNPGWPSAAREPRDLSRVTMSRFTRRCIKTPYLLNHNTSLCFAQLRLGVVLPHGSVVFQTQSPWVNYTSSVSPTPPVLLFSCRNPANPLVLLSKLNNVLISRDVRPRFRGMRMVGDHQPWLTLPSSLLRLVGRVRRQHTQSPSSKRMNPAEVCSSSSRML